MSAGGNIKKVVAGDPLLIPANAYNSFVDAARAERTRSHTGAATQQGSAPLPPNQVWVVSKVEGLTIPKFGVARLDNLIIVPTETTSDFPEPFSFYIKKPDFENTEDINHLVVMNGVVSYLGGFVRATISGLMPVLIRIQNRDHSFATIEQSQSTAHLRFTSSESDTPIRIMWKPSLTGVRWCVVYLGSAGVGSGGVFPIQLTKTSGGVGGATSKASFLYTIKDLSGTTLAVNANPSIAPHSWKREIGRMRQGTNGFAHRTSSGVLIIGWINERYEHATCDI